MHVNEVYIHVHAHSSSKADGNSESQSAESVNQLTVFLRRALK